MQLLCRTDTEVADLVRSYQGIPTPIVSDNLDRYPGAVGLRAFHGTKALVGPAFTVRTRSGDNRAIHEALEAVERGDVIVVDGGGDDSRALIGEIMMEIAISKGVAGFVVDGAIRDVAAFATAQFPCFARSVIHRGPYKFGPGELGATVSIGGQPVSPGDLVIGDEDGVLAMGPETARRILPAVREQMQNEFRIIESIRNGTYTGAYGVKSAKI